MTVASVPELRDLYKYFTPQYATRWRSIGTLLGLSSEALNIIENDKRGKTVDCCNSMLEKWLDIDTTASWEKLLAAIESPAASINGTINM